MVIETDFCPPVMSELAVLIMRRKNCFYSLEVLFVMNQQCYFKEDSIARKFIFSVFESKWILSHDFVTLLLDPF